MIIPIIYEDESILVINKPARVLVHAISPATESHIYERDNDEEETDQVRFSLVDWLAENYPGIREGDWPDPSRPGIVHRLDRDTSGVMVIAKTPVALAELQRQFHDRQVEKTYLAIIVGAPDWEEQIVKAPIVRSAGTRRRAQYLKLDARAKDAETHIRVLKRYLIGDRHLGLVEAQPKTGRTHQIRVHLSLLGYPILGDPWYRTKSSRELTQKLEVPRLMLHAQKITLRHPTTWEKITFTAPLPADFAKLTEILLESNNRK